MNNMQNDKGYIILNDVELKKKKKKNKLLLFTEYGLFIIVVGIIFGVYVINQNKLNNNMLMLEKDNSSQKDIPSKTNELVKSNDNDNKDVYINNDNNNVVENNKNNKKNYNNNSQNNTKSNVNTEQRQTTISNGIVVNEILIKEEEKPKEIKLIKLETNVSLKQGYSIDLIPVISPSDVENIKLKWSSNNDNVLVDQNGKVFGNNVGESVVTVTSENGTSASCVVKVETNKIDVSKIVLNMDKLNINIGSKDQLVATLSPNNTTERNVTWTSSDSNVVSVDNQGFILANSLGTATITAKTSNGKTATCIVKVNPIEVTSIKLNSNNLSMIENETFDLTATINPINATDKTVTWTSSNPNVATVVNGKVNAISVGETTITAKARNGKTATCIVKVNPIEVTSIKLNSNNLSMIENETFDLTATINPINATDKTVTWTSSNSNVATVVNGKVNAISVGETTITAKASNGKTATCIVNIIGLKYNLLLDNQNADTIGTKEIFYRYNYSKIINEKKCSYFTDSNLTNCLKNETIDKPSKLGYTFNGYYTESDGKGEKYINENGVIVNEAYKNIKSDTTLYAYWIINNYSINLNINGGNAACPSDYSLSNGLCSKMVKYNSVIDSLPTIERSGYKFDGWYTSVSGGEKITSLTIKSDTTIYAHWISNQPTINFVYFSQMSYSKTKFCGQNKTIANAGCGVTSAAMVATSLTGKNTYTPVYMMNMAYKAKFCGGTKSGTDPSFFRYFAKTLGLKFKQASKSDTTKVINYLKSGNSLVIAHMGKGTFTNNGHFIVLSRVDDKGNVYVNDPADKKKNGYYSISKIAKELKYDKSFYIISR